MEWQSSKQESDNFQQNWMLYFVGSFAIYYNVLGGKKPDEEYIYNFTCYFEYWVVFKRVFFKKKQQLKHST